MFHSQKSSEVDLNFAIIEVQKLCSYNFVLFIKLILRLEIIKFMSTMAARN